MTASASTSRAACSTDRRFPENLNGTDFGPNYLRATRHRYRIFLLGAKPGTAERAARRLAAICPQHEIVGCHHGHFDHDQVAELIDRIRRSKAEVLLVAMGNPKQELFIQKYLAATGCTLGIGVGALFDFLAGNVPRAKPWVQTLAARMAVSSGARAAPPCATLPGRHSVVLDAYRRAILVGCAG